MDVDEQQSRAARGNDPPMDLGDFEMTIDGRLHRDDVAVTVETIEK